MCTALSIKSKEGNNFFGRNMDLEYNFNQSVIVIPRNYKYENKVTGKMVGGKYAIIGMGSVIDNHAAMADGMNEKGLACAGLNFAGYAYYEENKVEGKENIAPYDFILWVLFNHETVDEVKEAINNIELVNVPLNEKYPVPTLHWMVVDKSGKSIVIEKTKSKFSIYDNTVGVLTNNPTFDWQLTNLNEYIGLTEEHPKETKWCDQEIKALGVGAGTRGIPGDFASVSRFVRIAFIKSRMPEVDNISAIPQFLHMLDYVAMVKGGAMTPEGKEDFTLYSSCMNQEKGIYYYKTYSNNRINAIDINKEDLNESKVKVFPYLINEDINYQN
ncbi:choloylglycine hydrolase family protein [Clostridium sp. Sa3CUN1]|uniref:choloylglycine hydrolase n=1 Tax=Clostridium gallinarum TaxID=2762246 RepID=A0ABR8Q4P3_9CLOT|nr:choloylglycine hydrolase [Clostridium gallinarum]MBD7915391.1 choloylglycine hydrolase family protein [Clostridium gallinarum]